MVVDLQNTDSENRVSSSSAFMPQIGSGSQRVGGTLFHWGANGVRVACGEGSGMGPSEHANNEELLSVLAGKPAAEVLMEQYGGLTPLAQASFDELQQVKGVGRSRAAAIKSAFLLAQRLTRESLPEAPVLDTPGGGRQPAAGAEPPLHGRATCRSCSSTPGSV